MTGSLEEQSAKGSPDQKVGETSWNEDPDLISRSKWSGSEGGERYQLFYSQEVRCTPAQ